MTNPSDSVDLIQGIWSALVLATRGIVRVNQPLSNTVGDSTPRRITQQFAANEQGGGKKVDIVPGLSNLLRFEYIQKCEASEKQVFSNLYTERLSI